MAALLDLAEQHKRELHRRKSQDYEQLVGFRSDLYMLKNLRRWVGDVLVDERSTCNVLRDKLRALAIDRKWSAGTWNRHRAVLSLGIRLGRKEGVLSPAVVFDLEHRRENNARVRWFSPDEFARLRLVIEAKHTDMLPRFDLAVNTGLRLGNVMRLPCEMVDWFAVPQPVLRVPTTKNGEPLNVPLNAAALAAIEVQGKLTGGKIGLVFGGKGRSKDATFKNVHSPEWFQEALAEAGIADFHWHDLRHHFASMLIQRGASLSDVSKLLGHKGLAMTQRYAHQNMTNLAAAVNTLDVKQKATRTATPPIGDMATYAQGVVN